MAMTHECGGADPAHIERAIVQDSHRRSRHFGLDPAQPVSRELLTARSLADLREQQERFLRYARPALDRLLPQLAPYGYVALLADPHGNILHSAGDPEFLKKADRVCLKPGANWQESERGTNAIGTAIALRAPVRIHAAEHYLANNAFLTCSASPVHAPDGTLLGVLDLTGHCREELSQASSLVAFAAEAVETRLLLEHSRKEKLEILQELDAVSSLHGRALVALDECGRVVYLNRSAKRSISAASIGREWSDVLESYAQKSPVQFRTVFHSRKRTWAFVNVGADRRLANGEARHTFDGIYVNCPRMRAVIETARRAAEHSMHILLLGESGTGKELFAQSIHNHSARAGGPFVAVNCSAIPEALIESELFGYEGGAFTGAAGKGSPGKFRAADRGTIFLDEIGDMDQRAQAALLRVLQEGRVTPVGSAASHEIDVRVIAATHRNLWAAVESGHFRQDLYFRLKGIVLELMPLRERSDIIGLAKDLLRKPGYGSVTLNPSAQKAILSYDWPGNVRELQSSLQQALFLSRGTEIGAEHLRLETRRLAEGGDGRLSHARAREIPLTGDEPRAVCDWERAAIERALEVANGNISRAADILQIGRTTLYRKMRKYRVAAR
jgi:transcriptional regulator of acetoin/glycerol metabolism